MLRKAIESGEVCTGCGEAEATVERLHSALCRFCSDCLRHELKTRTDAVRDHGQYHRGNRGPNFLAIFGRGAFRSDSLGYGLYLPRTPKDAMNEAVRLANRNGWMLLRLDRQRTLEDIYVHPAYRFYFPDSKKIFLPYDWERYGALREVLA